MVAGREGFGRWPTRLLAALGALLLVLGSLGWWMSTRVLDADGFADVAAKATDRQAVRDYIADRRNDGSPGPGLAHG